MAHGCGCVINRIHHCTVFSLFSTTYVAMGDLEEEAWACAHRCLALYQMAPKLSCHLSSTALYWHCMLAGPWPTRDR
ncbi:hypothetical protein GUJ93_ZPchr0014g46849 [Zizania palustris]|uniref:Uncharacterized protein n=1 Tax=Zizania palustris TaxID=103762 RepID=A0A8J5SX30_ZIZPA|nr:hypothetical protein GUJ93_ZPchr0014g46849 [Zizania palustris]